MSVPTRIAAFVSLLVLVFAAAAFAGSRIDPGVDTQIEHTTSTGTDGHAEDSK